MAPVLLSVARSIRHEGENAVKARIHWVAAVLVAVLLVAFGHQWGRCADRFKAPATKQAQAVQSLVGVWQADTVSMTPPSGSRRQIDGKDAAFNVTITDKTFTMRMRDKPLAEMSYVLDAKQKPCAIDLKSADGVMLGICERKGDRLRISVNDEAQGRPHDFDDASGMVLNLTAFEVESLFAIHADGSGRRCILTMPDYTVVGSPDWSRDGKRIAFDAWKSVYGEGLNSAHVLLVNADGRGMKDLGPGAMPSWSLDDKQLAFSSYGPDRGVCIMSADGSDRRCVAPDGWAFAGRPSETSSSSPSTITAMPISASTTWRSRSGDCCSIGHTSGSTGGWRGRPTAHGSPSRASCPKAARNCRGQRRRREERLQDHSLEGGGCGARQRRGTAGLGRKRKPDSRRHATQGQRPLATLRRRFQRWQAAAVASGSARRLGFRRHDLVAGRQANRVRRLPVREGGAGPTAGANAGRASRSINNLKQIALGMLNHQAATNSSPCRPALIPKANHS